LILINSCTEDEKVPEVAGELVVTPASLEITNHDTAQIFIAIQPKGEYLWEISQKPYWLTIKPDHGKVNLEPLTLQVIPLTEGMIPGEFNDQIEFITHGAGKASVSVTLLTRVNPLASIDVSELCFSTEEHTKTFTISNKGIGFLEWELESGVQWVEFLIQEGRIGGGEKFSVITKLNANKLDVGVYHGTIKVKSNSTGGEILIDVSAEIKPFAKLTSMPGKVNFGHMESNKGFYLKNEGNIPVVWSIDEIADYLEADISSGQINPGDSLEVRLNVNRDDLANNTYKSNLLIKYNESTLNVAVEVVNFNIVQMLAIDGKVIDAVYDSGRDLLIVVTDNPRKLFKIDPLNLSFESLSLNMTPTSLSVGMDGKYAAVGHDGRFSYINLETMIIEKIYHVPVVVFSIVLAPNGWVYAFPATGQWTRIYCVNLENGNVTQNNDYYIRHQTKAKLHPSGNFIYGAYTDLSPSNIEKYDIRNGTASYMYRSPYHGDFDFGGNLWFSDDGELIFARSRNVFRASLIKEQDLTYFGSLSDGNQNYLATIAHSSKNRKIYAIMTVFSYSSWIYEPTNEIRIYDSEYLGFEKSITIPDMMFIESNDSFSLYRSLGYHGFFNSDGTRFFVVAKAEKLTKQDSENWAVISMDVK
jgi:hypothetical protein